jgi:hypothetical protein
MSKKFQLSIPAACHENWEAMTPVEKGKFCASCNKKVFDFTSMNDRELAAFFKNPNLYQTGESSLCGRFRDDQLNREIEISKKRIPWVKYFFQFALPAFLVSAKTAAQGQVRIKDTCANPALTAVEYKNTLTGDTIYMHPNKAKLLSFKIDGWVSDAVTGTPVSFASIVIKELGKVMIADSMGKFSENISSAPGMLTLEISSVGYETKLWNHIVDFSKPGAGLTIQLMPAARELAEIVIQNSMGIIKRQIINMCGGQKRKPGQNNETMNLKSEYMRGLALNLYPNPVPSGSSINIEWQSKETGNFRLALFSMSGRLVFRKNIWVDAEARLLNIRLPHLAAGTYLLNMLNTGSGKVFSGKIVLQ